MDFQTFVIFCSLPPSCPPPSPGVGTQGLFCTTGCVSGGSCGSAAEFPEAHLEATHLARKWGLFFNQTFEKLKQNLCFLIQDFEKAKNINVFLFRTHMEAQGGLGSVGDPQWRPLEIQSTSLGSQGALKAHRRDHWEAKGRPWGSQVYAQTPDSPHLGGRTCTSIGGGRVPLSSTKMAAPYRKHSVLLQTGMCKHSCLYISWRPMLAVQLELSSGAPSAPEMQEL